MKRMPVIFAGHGSPMLAIEDSEQTRGLQQVGKEILQNYGKPKAILAISAHWYTKGTFIQSTPKPKQIYDMYGFPDELYKITYPVKGYMPLTKAVQLRLGNTVSIDDSWGIDHGTWTILIHIFPNADIPVVQLSVNGYLNARESYELGKQLITLRDEGYLIIGNGNIVHNLGKLEWDNVGGSTEAIEFNTAITNAVTSGDIKTVTHFESLPHASYAVPTPEHYLPLSYTLGAADGDDVRIFNDLYSTGSLSLTSYIWG